MLRTLFRRGTLLLAGLCVTCAASLALAADSKKVTYTDPKKAAAEDPDFLIQGEYAGKDFGAQIVALGDGKFQLVVYPGGLPGDGWDASAKIKHSLEGTREGSNAAFKGKEHAATLTDGALTISKGGTELAKLKRVERVSKTMGEKAPEGAKILFDGTNAAAWDNPKKIEDGLLMAGVNSKEKFQDQKVHIEFRLPYQPKDRGQGRGNSGIYLQGRYEVQMLDSFGLKGENNECGGLYTIKAPDVNMCYPPLAWQTYDIEYTAAKYGDDGKLATPPKITVYHNGVLIHKDVQLPKSTTSAVQKPGPESGPVHLQDHGNPVRYRNIWVKPL